MPGRNIDKISKQYVVNIFTHKMKKQKILVRVHKGEVLVRNPGRRIVRKSHYVWMNPGDMVVPANIVGRKMDRLKDKRMK